MYLLIPKLFDTVMHVLPTHMGNVKHADTDCIVNKSAVGIAQLGLSWLRVYCYSRARLVLGNYVATFREERSWLKGVDIRGGRVGIDSLS